MKIKINNLLKTNIETTDKKFNKFLNTLNNRKYITGKDILNYFNTRTNTLSSNTLNRDKTALKSYLKHNLLLSGARPETFYKLDLLFNSIKTKRIINKINIELIPNQEQVERVSSKLIQDGYTEQALLLLLLQSTGIRPGELRKLKSKDCHRVKEIIDNQTIEYYLINIYATKTKTIYKSIWSIELYDAVIKFYGKNNQYLITNPRTGNQYKANSFYRRFKIVKKYFNNTFYPYLCRHGFATNYYSKSNDIQTGALLLGHNTDTHSRYYIHTKLNISSILNITKLKTIGKLL